MALFLSEKELSENWTNFASLVNILHLLLRLSLLKVGLSLEGLANEISEVNKLFKKYLRIHFEDSIQNAEITHSFENFI